MINIKQDVQLQRGICPEKFQFDKIPNGQLVAIIDFNMRNILKYFTLIKFTWTIYCKTKCETSWKDYPEKFQLDKKFKMADLLPLTLICVISKNMTNLKKNCHEI